MVAEVLARVETELDEGSALANLVAHRFPDFDPQRAGDRELRRTITFLQRRGFSYGAIRQFFRIREGC
jgi:regulatory protein